MLRDEIAKLNDMGLLDELLKDKSTDKNILWATKAYSHLGKEYAEDKEITTDLITGKNYEIITNRAQKEKNAKATRTKQYAEVFTPFWICKRMNDFLDDDWLDCVDEEENGVALEFREGKTWQDYVSSVRMEITCGEAPFLTSRYDVATGEDIPLNKRIGLLDRKLKAVCENTDSFDEWLEWAKVAFWSTYGYEFQGDNLLIARINLLMTFEDNFAAKWGRAPEKDQYAKIIEIIAWNIWQMDGLTNCVPYSEPEKESEQITLDNLFGAEDKQECRPCKIYDWKDGKIIKYSTLSKRSSKMKFDYIIGNPPYQDKSQGANENDRPIYHLFYDSVVNVSNKVELITPGRFLFNAGSTPRVWNEKMLNNQHLKLLMYEPDSSRIFKNVDIKGGVAITYFDRNSSYEPIKAFTSYPELDSIRIKVGRNSSQSLSSVVTNRGIYRYSDKAYIEHPNEMKKTADRRIAPSSFERMPNLFTSEKPRDGFEYVQLLGNIGRERVYKWFRLDYISTVDNLYKYKVLIPKASGNGFFGEVLSAPLVCSPYIGFTETYISIGETKNKKEADACLKYIKTKFARAMLGILKVTQNLSRDTWQYVPLQDFTDGSDIDWSKSVSEIDKQLYKKYGLSDDEIAFIELHVKEME